MKRTIFIFLFLLTQISFANDEFKNIGTRLDIETIRKIFCISEQTLSEDMEGLSRRVIEAASTPKISKKITEKDPGYDENWKETYKAEFSARNVGDSSYEFLGMSNTIELQYDVTDHETEIEYSLTRITLTNHNLTDDSRARSVLNFDVYTIDKITNECSIPEDNVLFHIRNQ